MLLQIQLHFRDFSCMQYRLDFPTILAFGLMAKFAFV
jgi:hypothetical protein